MEEIIEIILLSTLCRILFIKFDNIIHVIITMIIAIIIGLVAALYIIFGLNIIIVNQVIIPEYNSTIANY